MSVVLNRAGELIRQFASALNARQLLMLSLYFDDSGTHGGPYCFVAGYAADTEAWAAFGDAWQALCDQYLNGRPFKTRKAYREKDSGFVPEEGRLKFARCIADHAEVEIWAALPEYYAQKIQDRYGHRFDRYRVCMLGVVEAVLNDYEIGRSKENLAWIFDHQGGTPDNVESEVEVSILRAFNDGLRLASAEQKHLVHSISFADDEKVAPLQGADFIAWHKRRRHADGADIPELPAYEILQKARVRHIETVWFDHKLEDLIDRITHPAARMNP